MVFCNLFKFYEALQVLDKSNFRAYFFKIPQRTCAILNPYNFQNFFTKQCHRSLLSSTLGIVYARVGKLSTLGIVNSAGVFARLEDLFKREVF